MPKQLKTESVIRDWVQELSFQQQALLMTAVRGPDSSSKHNTAKYIVRYLRAAVLKPAGYWDGTNNNDFMWSEMDKFADYSKAFWKDHDEYPHHFIMHLIHSAEVIGYCHPNEEQRSMWLTFYFIGCNSFHMYPETKNDMNLRLNDFRTHEH
jgi:hypothetical protein